MVRLHAFYRSLASWRVRIALAIKGIEAEVVSVDLLAGHQFAPAYAEANPEAAVPLLEIDRERLGQSMAILEYLEETRPDPPCCRRTRPPARSPAGSATSPSATATR